MYPFSKHPCLRHMFVIVSLCLVQLIPDRAAAQTDQPADRAQFSAEVLPLLKKHCVSCHGAAESNGGLRFDSRQGAFREGDSGLRAIVPGEPLKSELFQRITATDEGTRMPPEGKRLSKSEIQLLRDWIQSGAEWPEAAEAGSAHKNDQAASKHWSFQPISHPQVPASQGAWSAHPIDRFLEKARRDRDVKVGQDAPPRVVLRRLSYDLLGLPPSEQDVREFQTRWHRIGPERSVSEAVDQLLARPEYGERWGRRWMDWVRYADTAGDNSDFPVPQAYLYRNYIIDSLNRDLRYDQFLIEQLAGDLLPFDDQQQRNRQLIATGYLAMARRFGSLVETYPWHQTIEDTIDNIGRTMMGITLACARCHDHKFDPISTREYYGLYGFFASTRYPFPGIELFKAQHDFPSLWAPERTQQHLSKYAQQTTHLEKVLDELLEQCREKAATNARIGPSASLEQQRSMHDELERMLLRARKAGENLAKHLRSIPEYPTAYAVADSAPVDAAIQIKGQPDRPGAIVPRQFPQVLGGQHLPSDIGQQGSGRLELARWIASPENPLTARVIVNRVWQGHFGRGIVATTTDFGTRGQTPDHPELLDWLAADFIRHDWSLKHLHRRILTSRTYRLSSNPPSGNVVERDPDNLLLSYQRRQRLDAEAIRDTVLLLSGKLDRMPLRQPHPFPSRKDWGFTQHKPFADSYESQKRSVYLMAKRLTADRYFQVFDGPDRNACTQSRDQSITALQALYFVNNEFIHQQARYLAAQIPQRDDDTMGIDWLMRRLLQRSATSAEQREMRAHLEAARVLLDDSQAPRVLNQDQRELEVWASLVRGLMRLNEFIYLD